LLVLLLAVLGSTWSAEPVADPDAAQAVPLMTAGVQHRQHLRQHGPVGGRLGRAAGDLGYVQSLARLGFRSVRLPVAWDTYAVDGRIQPDKLARIRRSGWLDHGRRDVLRGQHPLGWRMDQLRREGALSTTNVFSPAAEVKFASYWQQIATAFRDMPSRLIFEA